MKKYSFILLLLCNLALSAQEQRKIPATRLSGSIKIDGQLTDPAWTNAPLVNDFSELRPVYKRKEAYNSRTEMKILYDDYAVYVSGYCHEQTRDSISSELGGRDKAGVNDMAGIMLDTYHDQINGVGFFVTALGEQVDSKLSLGYEDASWSTVYETATNIVADGWTFEMRIPYSALRFSTVPVQDWGINFTRKRVKAGRQYAWSPVDPNKFGIMNQAGLLTGLSNIKAPLRLSFSPYFSTYATKTPLTLGGTNKWETTVNGGMDVKYGLSKSFTLDMTLIPDFGQVQSDNLILNLSPFEVRYNENRAFFTEGTELFNKGNLFYSRRIGGRPYRRVQYDPSVDTLLEEPTETKLLNATKISGRTASGLGVGFFNAITRPEYATLRHKPDGTVYEYQTNDWTDYNILVLDQTMKNNSSVTLVNTTVLRNGTAHDARVTAGLFDLYDNQVNWNVWGKVANSSLTGASLAKNVSGYNYELNAGKFRGRYNFEVHHFMADANYQQNDLGYFTNNNYFDFGFNNWYKANKPTNWYNNLFFSLRGTYSQMYLPRQFQYVNLASNASAQFKNLWNAGIITNWLSEEHDYYEPRVAGLMFRRPASLRIGAQLSSNTAKKFSSSVEAYSRHYSKYQGRTNEFSLGNQYRFNNKFTISLKTYAEYTDNNAGYASMSPGGSPVYFGLRDRRTTENTATLKYNFNTKMGMNLRARHYWSKIHYTSFFTLQPDGRLSPTTDAVANPDFNLNIFNVDFVYTWQFAQGSFLNIGWKSAGIGQDNLVKEKYFRNLGNTLQASQQNTLSLKVIYYLDYLDLKKKLAKHPW